jgi:hypothetical protein
MLERLDRLLGFRWLHTRYRQFLTGGVFLKTEECPVDEIERYKRGANAMQVGGRHYKKLPIEPWDYIAANGLGFFEGNIIKYVTRAARTKNRDDLLKAQHYLAKLLEITPVTEDDSTLGRATRTAAVHDEVALADRISAKQPNEELGIEQPTVFQSARS